MCMYVCLSGLYYTTNGSSICTYGSVNIMPSGGNIGKVNKLGFNGYIRVIGYANSEYDIVNNIL